jgi:hypothetical protein
MPTSAPKPLSATAPMRCERTRGGWRVTLADGRSLRWEGFHTGPLTLSEEELDDISHRLAGVPLDGVPVLAEPRLRPFVSGAAGGSGERRPSIVLHSATYLLRQLAADVADTLAGRTPEDGATSTETRAVALARPGDIVVGRTEPWRVATEMADVEPVAVPGIEYYHLTHALLRLAGEATPDAPVPALERLAAALRRRPDSVMRLYSLDRETQLLLLHLMRLAGLDAIATDANGPEVAEWNVKTALHPSVEDALALAPGRPQRSPHELLAAETELAPLCRRLGARFPRMPGYGLSLDGGEDETVARTLAAARLLHERYGLSHGCLKPFVGGSGARIEPNIALGDSARLARLAAGAWARSEPLVLEANVRYARHALARETLELAPSGHVRDGRLAEGLTLQFLRGPAWQGNVLVDASSAGGLGLERGWYATIATAMEELHGAFARGGLRLATAGFDFAVGRVGGAFGDGVLVGVQDPSLRSHGAEMLRAFLDRAHAEGAPRYGATRVVHPAAGGSLPALRAVERDVLPGGELRVLTAIPDRWGMLAAAAETPAAAAGAVLDGEAELARRGLLVAR